MLNTRQLFLLNTAQTSNYPRLLEIDYAEGIYLYDPKEKKYMDLVSGFAVSNIGHRHPKVVQAIKDQVDRYLHVTVYGEYIQAPQVKLAEKICSTLSSKLNSIYFVNSGAEAAEGALKLAKRFTGRTEIISCRNAYHGSTHGALSVMGNEYYKQAYRPLLPDIRFIEFNCITELDSITSHTAAIILETIQGEAGIRVPDIEYMQALRQRCNETGTLLILDEIQTGFGRTGKLYAFEHFGRKALGQQGLGPFKRVRHLQHQRQAHRRGAGVQVAAPARPALDLGQQADRRQRQQEGRQREAQERPARAPRQHRQGQGVDLPRLGEQLIQRLAPRLGEDGDDSAGRDGHRHRRLRHRRPLGQDPDGSADQPEEDLGGPGRLVRAGNRRRDPADRVVARRRVVGRPAPRGVHRAGRHLRRPDRVAGEARRRHQGHVVLPARPRRRHGPARLHPGGRAGRLADPFPAGSELTRRASR